KAVVAMELTMNGVKAYTNPLPEARTWALPENQRVWRVMFTDGSADAYVVTSVAVFGPVTGDEVMVFRADAQGVITDWRGLGRDTSHDGALVAGMRALLLERQPPPGALVVGDESDTLGACGCVDYHYADCPTR